MKILDRKKTVDHVLEAIDYQPILRSMAQSAVDAAFSGPNPAIKLQRDRGADPALAHTGRRIGRMASPLKKLRTPGLVAAATVAGVAAVSAAVSSERRRAGDTSA